MKIPMELPTSISLKHDDLNFLGANNTFIQNQNTRTKLELKYYIETEERGGEIELSLPHLCIFNSNAHILRYSNGAFKKSRYIKHYHHEKINNCLVTEKHYLALIQYIVCFMDLKDRVLIDNLLKDTFNQNEISIDDYNKIDNSTAELILFNSQECSDFISILPNLHFFSSIFDDIIKIIKESDIDFREHQNFQTLKEKFIEIFEKFEKNKLK